MKDARYDIRVLRELAEQYAEVAQKPVQEERRELWRAHNRRQPDDSPAYQRGYLNLLVHLPRARHFIETQPDDPPFTAPFWWAGFQAVGNVF